MGQRDANVGAASRHPDERTNECVWLWPAMVERRTQILHAQANVSAELARILRNGRPPHPQARLLQAPGYDVRTMMPLAPNSALPPICDDMYTAGVESDRCPQALETFPDYEVEVES